MVLGALQHSPDPPLLLHRYIFKAVLGTTLGALSVFAFVLLTGNALRDLLKLLAGGSAPIEVVGQLVLLLIPYVVGYALPLGLLTGILLTLGRLSAGREVTAMRAAGRSLVQIAAPIFALALVATAAGWWVHTTLAPQARQSYRAILGDLVRRDPLSVIQARTFIHDFPGYVIYVRDSQESELRDLWIWELDSQRRALTLVRAASGRFDYDAEAGDLVLTLRHATAELRDADDPDDLTRPRPVPSFAEATVRLPVEEMLTQSRRPTKISHLTRQQLRERQAELTLRLQESPAATAAQRQGWLEEGVRLRVQEQTRLAMACSPVALALLGVPLALQVGRRETYANAAIALGLALLYYFLVGAVDWLGPDPTRRPELLVWLPNLVYQMVGVGLLAKASR